MKQDLSKLPLNQLFTFDREQFFSDFSPQEMVDLLREMVMIRHFEKRAKQAYQQNKVGGFLHLYIGQEAVQTGAIAAFGKKKHHWIGSYRTHALALLLGATPSAAMCELYGKVDGVAKGRGGSMHFYADNMYGGMGIVGGQLPVGAGLAFSLQYQKVTDEWAICFCGDGAVAQGTFHETLNLATLWELPLILVIENNQYGMGTQIERAIAKLPVGESSAKAYGIDSYTVDGMDITATYSVFKEIERKKTRRPVIIEMMTHRFEGHSVSDAGLYRSKEELQGEMALDRIHHYFSMLEKRGLLTQQQFDQIEKEEKEKILEAMEVAEKSPFPNPDLELEEGVFAPDGE